jgi:hypothetical protein
MAMLLILIAMTHQRDIAATSQLLNQPQSELLAVILDALVGLVEGDAAAKELTSVPAPEICPTHSAGPILQEKPFTRLKVPHPLVIPRLLETLPANARRQNS